MRLYGTESLQKEEGKKCCHIIRDRKNNGENLQINVVVRGIKPSEIFLSLIKHFSWPSDSKKEYIWESESTVMFHKKKIQMLFKDFVVLYWLC